MSIQDPIPPAQKKKKSQKKTVREKKMSTPDPVPPAPALRKQTSTKVTATRRLPGLPPFPRHTPGLLPYYMLRHSDLVEKIITEYKLKPVKPEAESSVGAKPHFHYYDQIYVLPDAAWTEFSRQVIKDASTLMTNAKTVSMESMLQYTDAVHPIVAATAGIKTPSKNTR
jgi:hypothetical protein